MNTVEASGGDAVRDSAAAHAARDELRSRDDSVLIARDASDEAVPGRFVAFGRHIRPNATTPPISPPSIAGFRPCSAPNREHV
jgi:hypothetical protein